MANAKTYDFAFKILGGLDPSFAGSFKDADKKISQSNKTLKQLEKAMQDLEAAYKAGTISANSFGANSASIATRINKETKALEELTKQQEEYKSASASISAMGGGFKGMMAGATAGLGISTFIQDISAYQEAMGQAKAMTGATGEEWQNIQEAVKSVYVSGLTADMQDAAQATSQIQQIMGNLGNDLANTSKNAILLRDTFGMEVTESARAAKVMMEQFGVSEQQAYTLMAQGAQLGADKNGDLLDTLNEYSVQFKQMGFNAEGFMNILVSGAQSGVWSVDKIGDSIKEFNIRVKDGSKTTTEGFEAIGLNADTMAQKFAKGGDSAQEAFIETVNALKAIEDPVKRNQAGVNLFGTMWEDMGEKAVLAMADTNSAVDMNAKTMDDIAQNKLNNINTAFANLYRTIEVQFVAPLAEQATPAIQTFTEFLGNVDLSVLTSVISGVGAAIAAFSAASFIAGLGGISAAATVAATAIAAISWPVVGVALAFGVLVGAGLYLMQNWDDIKAGATDLSEYVGYEFTQTKEWILNNIREATDGAMEMWNSLVEFFSHPIEGSIKIIKNIIGSDEDPEGYAKGGLITNPTLAYFAEDGPEMAIPINNSDRSKSLWEKTGRMLGIYPKVNTENMAIPGIEVVPKVDASAISIPDMSIYPKVNTEDMAIPGMEVVPKVDASEISIPDMSIYPKVNTENMAIPGMEVVPKVDASAISIPDMSIYPKVNTENMAIPGIEVVPKVDASAISIPDMSIYPKINTEDMAIPGMEVMPKVDASAISIPDMSIYPKINTEGMEIPGMEIWPKIDTEPFSSLDLSKLYAETSSNNIESNIVFAPNITIQNDGNSISKQDVKIAINDAYEEFKKFMAKYNKEKRRLSYA
nr:MAG: minor tail protein [Bacteriophage sp.]